VSLLSSLLADSGTVTFLKGWDLTGNFTFVDLIAASTNALNGALLARRPDHYKNFTIVGVLLMALLAGLMGGISRDVMLSDVPAALTNPAYITCALVFGLIGYRLAYAKGQLFREGLFQFMTSFSLPWYAIVGAQKGVTSGIPVLGCILLAVVGPTAGRWFVDVSSGVTPKQFIRGEWFVSIATLTGLIWDPRVLGQWKYVGRLRSRVPHRLHRARARSLVLVGGAAGRRAHGGVPALGRAAPAWPQAQGEVAARAPRPRAARRGLGASRESGDARGSAMRLDVVDLARAHHSIAMTAVPVGGPRDHAHRTRDVLRDEEARNV
jgi:uncharacterized membrane protein YeiH